MSQSPPLIVITHTADAAADAAAIASQMRALGFEVDQIPFEPGPLALRALNNRLAQARRLIALWSSAAARTPGLRRVVNRAKSLGLLSIVRADATPVPASLRRFAVSPRPGLAQRLDWRGLIEAPNANAPTPTSRLHAVLVMGLMGLITAGAAYEADATFAASINAWVDVARAYVLQAVGAISG